MSKCLSLEEELLNEEFKQLANTPQGFSSTKEATEDQQHHTLLSPSLPSPSGGCDQADIDGKSLIDESYNVSLSSSIYGDDGTYLDRASSDLSKQQLTQPEGGPKDSAQDQNHKVVRVVKTCFK